MLDHKISGLPVVNDGGRVVGIISEHDLLRDNVQTKRTHWLRLMIERVNLADESGRLQERKVCEVMTPDPVTIAETASLEEAGRLMEENDIKRLPVMRDDKLGASLLAPIWFERFFSPPARSRMRRSVMK
jgi:CBS domain-containing protein